MSLNNKIKVDTLKWLKSLNEKEIISMVVNTTFDNCNSTTEKLNQLKNWNNKITNTDIKNIRKWVSEQLRFKKTRSKLISTANLLGKNKTCAMLGCSVEYLNKWINAISFHLVCYNYKYGENEIDIRDSIKILCNSMENIITDKTIELFGKLIKNEA